VRAPRADSDVRRTSFVGCTIVARNDLPYARVLSAAWLEHHRDAPFAVLVVDDGEVSLPEHERLRIVRADELGIEPRELDQMRGIYDVAELTTALKPRLVRHLLATGAGAVVHLESDIDLLGSVADVAEVARVSGVALSPHLLGPPPRDAYLTEIDYAKYGQYNSGLIAVGRAAGAFLDWWEERTRWDCLFDEAGGLHADQRWLDCVPVYFGHAVIRDAGLNVAAWNLHERPPALEDGRPTVAGVPLRAFHFSGFDPHRPERLSRHGPSPFDDDPILLDVRSRYARRLLDAGYDEHRTIPYGYGRTAAGTPLGRWERRVYREALLAAGERDDSVPSPFDAARSREFEQMLARPRSLGIFTEAQLGALENVRVRVRGGGWDRRRVMTAVERRLRAVGTRG
jgi:hypothetical protein